MSSTYYIALQAARNSSSTAAVAARHTSGSTWGEEQQQQQWQQCNFSCHDHKYYALQHLAGAKCMQDVDAVCGAIIGGVIAAAAAAAASCALRSMRKARTSWCRGLSGPSFLMFVLGPV